MNLHLVARIDCLGGICLAFGLARPSRAAARPLSEGGGMPLPATGSSVRRAVDAGPLTWIGYLLNTGPVAHDHTMLLMKVAVLAAGICAVESGRVLGAGGR